jgi:hypothetical protein
MESKITFLKEKNIMEFACSSEGIAIVHEGGSPLPP